MRRHFRLGRSSEQNGSSLLARGIQGDAPMLQRQQLGAGNFGGFDSLMEVPVAALGFRDDGRRADPQAGRYQPPPPHRRYAPEAAGGRAEAMCQFRSKLIPIAPLAGDSGATLQAGRAKYLSAAEHWTRERLEAWHGLCGKRGKLPLERSHEYRQSPKMGGKTAPLQSPRAAC